MIYLSKQSAEDLERLKRHIPHATVLIGPEGVGLYTSAVHLAGRSLSGVVRPTDIKGETDHTSSGIIRVTQIRDLAGHAMSKTSSERVYIIDNADQMNTQTQNAFLKLLEEPAAHVHFILTTHHVEELLPTVRSRVQSITLHPVDTDQSLLILDDLSISDETMRKQLLFLADGLPAELTRLVEDKAGFDEKAAAIAAARQFLQGTPFERLRVISEYGTSRARTLMILAYAQRILAHSLHQQPSASLVERANYVAESYDRIAANGHIKTQLLDLMV